MRDSTQTNEARARSVPPSETVKRRRKPKAPLRLSAKEYQDVIVRADSQRAHDKRGHSAAILALVQEVGGERKVRCRPTYPEQIEQIRAMEWLDAHLPDDAMAFHHASAPHKSAVHAAFLKAMGWKDGMPDVEVIRFGMSVYFEFKRPPKVLASGKLSKAKPRVKKNQIERIAQLRRCGCRVEVVQTLEEMARHLVAWNFIAVDLLSQLPPQAF